MPKDEIDPDDPMELCGVGFATREDTSELMTECFIEEFLRLGHPAGQILALFRNPHYTGMNMVLQNRGEDFVKAKITEVFGWWQREVTWSTRPSAVPVTGTSSTAECDSGAVDPTGAAIPTFRF
ncbi:MAG: hypothetical protein KJ072_24040 [Verrucomicrobia bacterium]|nr:hypothetical protein [Verrucomicrobiota bacterium]